MKTTIILATVGALVALAVGIQIHLLKSEKKALESERDSLRAEIVSMQYALDAKNASIDALSSHVRRLREASAQSAETHQIIADKAQNNAEISDYLAMPVPGELCSILHERLCNKPCGE